MTDTQLRRDPLPASGWKFSITEARILVVIAFIDAALAAALVAKTVDALIDSVSQPNVGLAVAITLQLATIIPFAIARRHDLLRRSWVAQFRSYINVILYSNVFGVMLGMIWPLHYPIVIKSLLIAPAALLVHHLAWFLLITLLDRRGHLAKKPIVLISPHAAHAFRFSERLLGRRYRILGEFHLDPMRPAETVQTALSYAHRIGAQELFVIETIESTSQAALAALTTSSIPAYILPSQSSARYVRLPHRYFGTAGALEIPRSALGVVDVRLKRLVDIIVAMVGLVLLSPCLLLVAMLIKLDSPGPIIYRQYRLGLLGQPFRIFKFRTMNAWQDGSQVAQATRDDARVTRVGRWLRSTSIDEIPQLLNVLKGDMSIVGPRPHAVAHDTYYSNCIQNYLLRQRVRPGLTGWAQVNAHRGETPTIDKMMKRVGLDLWYIDHWTLDLDLAIMLRTVVHLLRVRDAY